MNLQRQNTHFPGTIEQNYKIHIITKKCSILLVQEISKLGESQIKASELNIFLGIKIHIKEFFMQRSLPTLNYIQRNPGISFLSKQMRILLSTDSYQVGHLLSKNIISEEHLFRKSLAFRQFLLTKEHLQKFRITEF